MISRLVCFLSSSQSFFLQVSAAICFEWYEPRLASTPVLAFRTGETEFNFITQVS